MCLCSLDFPFVLVGTFSAPSRRVPITPSLCSKGCWELKSVLVCVSRFLEDFNFEPSVLLKVYRTVEERQPVFFHILPCEFDVAMHQMVIVNCYNFVAGWCTPPLTYQLLRLIISAEWKRQVCKSVTTGVSRVYLWQAFCLSVGITVQVCLSFYGINYEVICFIFQ